MLLLMTVCPLGEFWRYFKFLRLTLIIGVIVSLEMNETEPRSAYNGDAAAIHAGAAIEQKAPADYRSTRVFNEKLRSKAQIQLAKFRAVVRGIV